MAWGIVIYLLVGIYVLSRCLKKREPRKWKPHDDSRIEILVFLLKLAVWPVVVLLKIREK